MKAKKYFVALIAVNALLLGIAASLDHQHSCRGLSTDRSKPLLTGPSGKFGPVVEAVLRSARSETSVEIFDLETASSRRPPPLDDFDHRADAIMAWIRSNGLDISCSPLPGRAACITHDMTLVPVDAKCWEQTAEQELIDNPALAPVTHSPRRLLVLGNDQPDTYMFRTGKGTLGMLRLVPLSEHQRGVKLRYKLINPLISIIAST